MGNKSEPNIMHVGDGQVFLLAGGGKIFTDMVAKFCRSEEDVETIATSPYNKKLLKELIHSRHKAALEFDDFIFGIQGYSRVAEIQLVRKRHASYMIKSGRVEFGGKRKYNMVVPKNIEGVHAQVTLSQYYNNLKFDGMNLSDVLDKDIINPTKPVQITADFDLDDIMNILCTWYDTGLEKGVPEEDLRYLKPQATEFRAVIKMNAAALYDWFQIRMCNHAQTELRDMARKMYQLGMEACPDIFEEFGPSCKILGYCPESKQCAEMKGLIPDRETAKKLLASYRTRIKSDSAAI